MILCVNEYQVKPGRMGRLLRELRKSRVEEELRKSPGKVRAIGLSNFTAEQIREILAACQVKPAVLQTEVHPYSQEKELKKFLQKEGMVIQA